MARAFICLARNDIEDNFLQVLDLKPNSSLRVPAYEPPGQTGYVTWAPQADVVATTDGGGGVWSTNAIYDGLAAYLIDNVENVGAGPLLNDSLTAAQANGIADRILTRVANGQVLTLADINTAINAEAGVAVSDLNGVVANSNSTGSAAGVLRILSGEAYRLPAASQVSDAGNAFPVVVVHTPLGAFVALGAAGFRNFRQIIDTGALHLSVLSGVLSHLAVATYVWLNPGFTYGAGGTALTVGGDVLPATGAARAITVYDATGAVI